MCYTIQIMVRMRSTKSRQGNRRSQHGVTSPAHTTDEDGVVRQRHRASRQSGKYRGRSVMDVTREVKKAEKRAGRAQQGGDDGEKKTVEQVAAPK